jgi:tRNA A37 methylthiotransferase MiaB
MFNFSTINLGCTKNLVDSQYVIGKILSYNNANLDKEINYISDPYSPDTKYVFLNTCGFLSSGRAETMETLRKLVDA